MNCLISSDVNFIILCLPPTVMHFIWCKQLLSLKSFTITFTFLSSSLFTDEFFFHNSYDEHKFCFYHFCTLNFFRVSSPCHLTSLSSSLHSVNWRWFVDTKLFWRERDAPLLSFVRATLVKVWNNCQQTFNNYNNFTKYYVVRSNLWIF